MESSIGGRAPGSERLGLSDGGRVACHPELTEGESPATTDRPNADIAEIFGENLRYAREKAGLNQEELGLRADLHRTEISQVERGLAW
jgi:ribosome-binding protein aMBF1 (putative translation factor)